MHKTQYRVVPRKTCLTIAGWLLIAVGLTGCATRQVSESLQGSTAQRLVTYSLENFVTELVAQGEFEALSDKAVALNVHFLNDHALLSYATELLRHRFQRTYGVDFVDDAESADFQVSVFFNSIATDHDSYGLTVPTFGLVATPDSRLNLLAIDMFHGVTEGYAVIRSDDNIDRTRRLLVRVRADNVATPIIDFPVNQLD